MDNPIPKKPEANQNAAGRSNPGSLTKANPTESNAIQIPEISLPKGGGSIQGIGEKFSMNPVTGSGSMSVPIAVSAGRSGFSPQLGIGYDSGAGNSPFGLGWNLSVPAITRKTAKGLPLYQDEEGSDIFLLSGAEDLVPTLLQENEEWVKNEFRKDEFSVRRYRPRTEGLFARIEKWKNTTTGEVHWKSTTPDNITTIFGRSTASRIADPEDSTRIFSWLLEESYDDKGNIIRYEYKKENTENIEAVLPQEGRRLQSNKSFANRYIKRIKYSNQNPGERDNWLFEVVFDYGEHAGEDEIDTPTYDAQRPWLVRKDPFSNYRAGFEIRTYRLCRRVLMFHHFEELGTDPCLVSSTNFGYEERPHLTRLTSVVKTGYLRTDTNGSYSSKSMPPVTFGYTEPKIDPQVQSIEPESLENLPIGLDGGSYQWVDLDGEGLSGVLTQKEDAWFYKRNLGQGRFAPIERLTEQPSLATSGSGSPQIMDLNGDGLKELVLLEPPLTGYFAKNAEIEEHEHDWKPFRPFQSVPNVDWNDPNLRLIDLNGDGFSDILLTEDQVFRWYPSKGLEGFGASSYVSKAIDEEHGPALVFADADSSVFLADMSGDGLTDIVRIRNNEVCYWPNLGYGRFGEKILMDHPPHFDFSELFDPGRIRLTDIDGSGTIDILYLRKDKICLWYNQAGNSWSKKEELTHFPSVDNMSSVMVIDLLGNGTACLVWSSPLPEDAGHPMRYIDLMGGQKPHLLISTTNNMGAETRLQYAPSTKFYLEDKAAGKPWITKLPFPVHVLEKMEVRERVTNFKMVSSYKYHHGYFDGVEREFRGFGMVEQLDTESFLAYNGAGLFTDPPETVDGEFYQPPVLTKTWFHTGAHRVNDKISQHYLTEYYQGDPEAVLLADSALPQGLNTQEEREACRALRGTMLRQEVYALDGKPESEHPYSVVESKSHIKLVQPLADNPFAVFYVCNCESLTYQYERNPADPRIAHSHTLALDPQYFMPLQTAAIAYPRRGTGHPAEQMKLHVVCSETEVTHLDQSEDFYRIGLPVASRSYEVTGLTPAGPIFQKAELQQAIATATAIPYEATPSEGEVEKRLLEQSRVLYYDESLTESLPLGQANSRAMPYASYQLAFSEAHLNALFAGRAAIPRDVLEIEGRYVELDGDGQWWTPSGRVIFDPAQFYLPVEAIDPFGSSGYVQYDRYALLAERAWDVYENTIESQNDYRVLGPVLVTDPNRNRAAVAHDELGMVVSSAVMGKVGTNEGDTLADPTARMEYELFNWIQNGRPNFVRTFARERHGPDNPRWQESYGYSDGFGREIMTKVQAESGEAPLRDEQGNLLRDEQGNLVVGEVEERWIGNGRTVYDNKGNPVKQYEPFFSSTPAYEDEAELVEQGVTPILHYDALGRNIRTDLPDGTFTKVEFDPWQQTSFDPNDTVLESRWYAERGALNPNDPEPTDPETRAAWLAARHADTPSRVHLDTLGRPFLGIDHNIKNGADEFIETRTVQDIEGNPLRIIDARGNTVMEYGKLNETGPFVPAYTIGGLMLYQNSMDAGESWLLSNIAGNPIHSYDSRGHHTFMRYDALQRPLEMWVEYETENRSLLTQRTVYGDNLPNAEDRNLRGQVYQAFDGAGLVTTEAIDFKGNLLRASRQLTREYRTTIDWSSDPALEEEIFTTSATYDALNRAIESVAPDGSVHQPRYNEANLLDGLSVRLRDAEEATEFVRNIDYDAKGQRTRIRYGNGATTRYTYDSNTFRLTHLRTTRQSPPSGGTEGELGELQNLHYNYDPVGNITEIRDNAQQTVYFQNTVVEPHSQYEYDALYRLIRASGREHAGHRQQRNHRDIPPLSPVPLPNNEQALHRYVESYNYDVVGNILRMNHRVGDGGWNRYYDYASDSNRLLATGDTEGGPYSFQYPYDAHGNMIQLPHLPEMRWDYADQLQSVDLGGGGTAYYVYDASGQRTRKVIERNGGRRDERIYLGGFEVYREHTGGGVQLERETLHIMPAGRTGGDDQQRIAMVDTLTIAEGQDRNSPQPIVRYQLGNHLGSASLELDADAAVISYEEYHHYGTSALRLGRSNAEVSLKRYRYTGMERDEETGMNYHGARYYLPWLGRWGSTDPIALIDGINLYSYSRNNPINLIDISGLQSRPRDEYDKSQKNDAARHKRRRDKITRTASAQGKTPDPMLQNEARYRAETGRTNLQCNHHCKVAEARRIGTPTGRSGIGREDRMTSLHAYKDSSTYARVEGVQGTMSHNKAIEEYIDKPELDRSPRTSRGHEYAGATAKWRVDGTPANMDARRDQDWRRTDPRGFSKVDADIDLRTGKVITQKNNSSGANRKRSRIGGKWGTRAEAAYNFFTGNWEDISISDLNPAPNLTKGIQEGDCWGAVCGLAEDAWDNTGGVGVDTISGIVDVITPEHAHFDIELMRRLQRSCKGGACQAFCRGCHSPGSPFFTGVGGRSYSNLKARGFKSKNSLQYPLRHQDLSDEDHAHIRAFIQSRL